MVIFCVNSSGEVSKQIKGKKTFQKTIFVNAQDSKH